MKTIDNVAVTSPKSGFISRKLIYFTKKLITNMCKHVNHDKCLFV